MSNNSRFERILIIPFSQRMVLMAALIRSFTLIFGPGIGKANLGAWPCTSPNITSACSQVKNEG